MRWVFLGALYLIGLPVTIHAFKTADTLYLILALILGYTLAFVIGLFFRRKKQAPHNRLILKD